MGVCEHGLKLPSDGLDLYTPQVCTNYSIYHCAAQTMAELGPKSRVTRSEIAAAELRHAVQSHFAGHLST